MELLHLDVQDFWTNFSAACAQFQTSLNHPMGGFRPIYHHGAGWPLCIYLVVLVVTLR
jgi:hypothetical protein